jgi:Tol biopolymer transport system component
MALALACAAALVGGVIAQAAIHDKLVSRTSDGTPANGDSSTDASTALSKNGRFVAFESRAANLPGGDGTVFQAYVLDTESGKARLMSTDDNGNPASASCAETTISANGRFVGFAGLCTGLPGANGVDRQVWIHDRETGKTRLVSRSNGGDPGDGGSEYPSISAGGRYVVFSSTSSNLPGGDGTNQFVYVRDTQEKRTILASKTNAGDPAPGSDVFGQSVSSDGRVVLFESVAAGLPAGDGTTEHIYVRDLDSGHTSLVDRNSNGEPGNGSQYYPSISGNGRFVGFESTGTNMPGGDGTDRQAYLRDLRRGTTVLVSRNAAGRPQNGDAYYPHPSGDGRYVAFLSDGDNLPGGDGLITQIYVRDLQAKTTRLLSRADNGDPADGASDNPSISVDGRFAAFSSTANNLGGDPNYFNAFRAGPIH